jgi:hypothetical protein
MQQAVKKNRYRLLGASAWSNRTTTTNEERSNDQQQCMFVFIIVCSFIISMQIVACTKRRQDIFLSKSTVKLAPIHFA